MADEKEKPKVIIHRTKLSEMEEIPVEEEQVREENIPVASNPQESKAPEPEENKLTPETEKIVSGRVLEFTKRLTEQNKITLERTVEQIKRDLAPPTEADVQKLLDQSYLTFTVKIKFPAEAERKFTLEELPQAIEKKFYKSIKDKIIPAVQGIIAERGNLLDGGDIPQKILSMMNKSEPVFEIMAICAALALNPRDMVEGLDAKWVEENLSSMRILSIINAQAQCNRMRDFFSILSHGMKALK